MWRIEKQYRTTETECAMRFTYTILHIYVVYIEWMFMSVHEYTFSTVARLCSSARTFLAKLLQCRCDVRAYRIRAKIHYLSGAGYKDGPCTTERHIAWRRRSVLLIVYYEYYKYISIKVLSGVSQQSARFGYQFFTQSTGVGDTKWIYIYAYGVASRSFHFAHT